MIISIKLNVILLSCLPLAALFVTERSTKMCQLCLSEMVGIIHILNDSKIVANSFFHLSIRNLENYQCNMIDKVLQIGYYCMIDGTLLLLIMNQLILAWILYELLNPTSICWNEIIQYANETYTAFDNQIMQQFGLINQRLHNQMHLTLETCIEIRLETLLGKSLDINNIKTLKFPFRNQMITGLFKGILALLTNSWHIWLTWHARLPTTITPNNVALPVLNIGALSSLFWIIISIIYQWSNLWYEKSLLEQAPTLPFAEIRLLLLISIAILINWLLLYTLYRAFIENKNGIARILSKSDEKSK
uniref:Uncharacterized protein n=3 Tax=Wuchereria bancrofti TaxID=6293 RepID=A0A1I8EA60_WUCBA